jgi:hypothetical protein
MAHMLCVATASVAVVLALLAGVSTHASAAAGTVDNRSYSSAGTGLLLPSGASGADTAVARRACAFPFTGANCDVCLSGYYGATCQFACSNCNGICTDGVSGSCVCEPYWSGPPACTTSTGFSGLSQVLLTTAVWVSYNVNAADLDNDGDFDALSASDGDGKVAVYRNNNVVGSKDVPFAGQTVVGTVGGCWFVATGDLNGDGLLDLAAGGWSGAPQWYQNLGNAAFSGGAVIGSNSDGRYLEIVDLDNNGVADVIMSSSVTKSIRLFQNTRAVGSSTVSFTERPSISANCHRAVTADLDLDGRVDFVYQDIVTNDRLLWHRNLGAFSFAAVATACVLPSGYQMAGDPLIDFTVDFDADGDVDLVMAATNTGGASHFMMWCENLVIDSPGSASTGTASFTAPTSIAVVTGRQVSVVSVADVDGDGLLDIIVGAPTMFWLRRRTLRPPTFSPPITFGAVPSAFHVVFRGDFNRDGLVDGMVASPFPYSNSQVNFFRNVHTLPAPVCPPNTYYVAGVTPRRCKPCISQTTSLANATTCTCIPGYRTTGSGDTVACTRTHDGPCAFTRAHGTRSLAY